jgi:hypothetical protein
LREKACPGLDPGRNRKYRLIFQDEAPFGEPT